MTACPNAFQQPSTELVRALDVAVVLRVERHREAQRTEGTLERA